MQHKKYGSWRKPEYEEKEGNNGSLELEIVNKDIRIIKIRHITFKLTF